MTEGDIEFLGRKLVYELDIQPWLRPWEGKEILREYLRIVKVPANVWPPKEREVQPESDSSVEVAKELEEKKQKVQERSAEESLGDVSMVYALLFSFRAKYIEFEQQIYTREELSAAQLQLEYAKAADAAIFEKPSALQTSVLKTELTVGSKTLQTAFFAVDVDSHYNLLLGHDWIHANECVPSTLHGKLFQWTGDRVEKIRAEGRSQIVDINVEDVGHINWVDTDPDQISFVRVTKEEVQLVLLKDTEALVALEEPPDWLK
uniref:Uncharacterized protein n=1 Tax=Ananas comosus var. bracteatus TaxID=296719 RepID=A0A6V7PLP3_ANACO|nr:unnamed protein product [Ananas comosus var. bracteatus]